MVPFRIRDIAIDPPLILSPMAGVTDYTFRRLIKRRGGVGLVVPVEAAGEPALVRAGMTWRAQLGRKGVVTSALGITQTLAWGSTYYLTAVFADPVSADLHLSRTWFFGSFSAALLLSGLLGPLAGRTIDRYGGRDVLAATNLVFAAGLALLSFASGPVSLAIAWLVIGAGMGFGLYV